MAMLCDGANIKEESLASQNQAQLSICQLIVFNCIFCRKKQRLITWHNKSCEPLLPVYLGVFLHNKTRKRELDDMMYELGFLVSYNRVVKISTDLGTKIYKYYDRLNTVCPPHLKKVYSLHLQSTISITKEVQPLQRVRSLAQVSLCFNTEILKRLLKVNLQRIS